MLQALGFDIYVVNYRMDGACRKHGLVSNPLHGSHCASGDFDGYMPEIDAILTTVAARNYAKVVAYAHSTGAPVMLQYLLQSGNTTLRNLFDGFVLNSPFLDWGHQSDVAELVLKNSLQCSNRLTASDFAISSGGNGPGPWALKIWSQYEFDPALRPMYSSDVTKGFACAATKAHKRIQESGGVTNKPIFVITATGDDTLEFHETEHLSQRIPKDHTDLTITVLPEGRHDVFLSMEPETVGTALEFVCAYMVGHGWTAPVTECNAADWLA